MIKYFNRLSGIAYQTKVPSTIPPKIMTITATYIDGIIPYGTTKIQQNRVPLLLDISQTTYYIWSSILAGGATREIPNLPSWSYLPPSHEAKLLPVLKNYWYNYWRQVNAENPCRDIRRSQERNRGICLDNSD